MRGPFITRTTITKWFKQFWKLYLNLCSCKSINSKRSRVKSSERKYQWFVYFLKSNKIDHYIMGHFIPTTAKRELFFMVGRNFISGFIWRTCHKTGCASFISVLLRRVEVLILIDRAKSNQWNLMINWIC